ncbi:hypothetical protein [Thiorhodovibrio frisius]|uniref:Uncharacterized protein n=1 Tax=Thiorhodovibrio frisius TaxID=631362 RepID=H8Z470_9GAMM|nr:hypothetical protein [Thiorhodovibrio frisius]EIC21156.1 hypothetical protein Thi970DRAFT_04846 [Thiorhodovibrio frisius]WPL22379.1 hypothetical protein Thiofri_02543 [Thiorhodovibrio frisius]
MSVPRAILLKELGLEFLAENSHAFGSVDLGMDGREQQGEKRGEELLQGFFTGAVLVAPLAEAVSVS